MLHIWGRKNSSQVIPVLWLIGELNIEYILHRAGGSFGGLDTPDYIAMNPNQKVPTIKDGDFVLWESQAIIRYLAKKYGPETMSPSDPQQWAIIDQWFEWAAYTAFPSVFPIFWTLVRTPIEDRDMAMVTTQVEIAGKTLQILESQLEAKKFVTGEHFTFADITLGTIVYRYYNLPIEHKTLPNTERWYASLCDRPAFREHVMIAYGNSPEEWDKLEKQGEQYTENSE